ncbi:DNA mismatch repair protein MutS [Treponema bryantii]|uniref:DNA mismatch repair protein MutS n=1 Tax=Treponema bryantii TaxID=163 RepID=A0A1H9ACF4_9SPIR|nr:DNA mismatch repair protein MutS [Treponema bryantii]SEP74354.1 DNA mismatch repair protein MutS [Treponema bryantii]
MADEENLTPMMIQYRGIKEKYKTEVVFFRLGDFYEMFNEDAVEVSRLLNLTLTHRANQPMCGIPYHAAKIYIARLLRLGKKIVICEQVGEIPKGGKGIAERKVVEIITPGTAVEAEYLDGSRANYLAALSITKGKAGFAFIDVTTSSFRATSWPASKMAEFFGKELNRAAPRELLLPVSLKNNEVVKSILEGYGTISVSYYPDWDFSADLSFKKLTAQFKTANLKAFGLEADSPEVVPAGFLLDYLEKTTNTTLPHVSSIRIYCDSEFLIMDDSSRRNLEVVSNMRDGSSQYTLIECVDFTKTAMGGRLLRNWLLFPLTNLRQIEDRQTKVASFVDNRTLLDKVKNDLSGILDVERLAGRIAMERAHAKDLQALRTSLEAWSRTKEYLGEYDFSFIDDDNSKTICGLIENAILDDPSTSLTDGGIIKAGWSEELDHWRSVHDNFNQILSEYEAEEKEKTGIPTLRVKYTNAAGYFIEVSKGKLGSVPAHFIMRRALVNGDRYTTERLQQLEQELNESSTKILELERDLFVEVRTTLAKYIPYLLQIADEIANTDAACSFAQAAIEHNWVRPEMEDSSHFEIKDGRHPVVENHLPTGEFVPNDAFLSAEEKESSAVPAFALITGPNMAGKSTYLRQNALIALLAQTGSYVPAKSARLGIVDRIFCRVGASDNLAKGESTFLVEMTETANILHAATSRSLVIMDEVGRGTSTEDGLAIARAVSEYLLDTIGCKTFFATHYHELSRMEHPRLKMLCMDVLEQNGSVVFLRKVKEGVTENSYGIHVAKLAGIPQSVIERANTILAHIQALASDNPILLDDIPAKKESQSAPQMPSTPGLFSDEEIIISEILSTDTDNLTPLNALQAIARWKKALSGL